MQKTILLIFLSCFFIKNGQCQITKGNWMVGGSGTFEKSTTSNLFEVKANYVRLSPNIGYFFIDKLAAGVKAGFDFNQLKYNGGISESTQFSLGPVARYYFLNADNRINLFAEGAYEYSHLSGGSGSSDYSNTWTLSMGPVVYLNSSVGLEFTINYKSFRYNSNNESSKSFFLSIGFQIHLERDKD